MLRSLRPADLVSLLSRPGPGAWWSAARPREHLGSETAGPALLGSLLEHWLPLGGSARTWVWQEKEDLKGLASARPRSGRGAWEVDWLLLAEEATSSQACTRMLEGITEAAGTKGVCKVFLRLEEDTPLLPTAQRAGFSPYLRETLYTHLKPQLASRLADTPIRAAGRHDAHALYQLYQRTTPYTVQQAEALTFSEWLETRDRGTPALRRREYLYEEEGSVLGCTLVQGFGRTGYLEVMVDPHAEGILSELVRFGLARLRRRGTILCLVPEYRPLLASTLRFFGFVRSQSYLTLVKQLSLRIPEVRPVRAPAQRQVSPV